MVFSTRVRHQSAPVVEIVKAYGHACWSQFHYGADPLSCSNAVVTCIIVINTPDSLSTKKRNALSSVRLYASMKKASRRDIKQKSAQPLRSSAKPRRGEPKAEKNSPAGLCPNCATALHDAEARLEFEVSQQTNELEAEVARLREASHAKDEFIRITNHELRTPLDVIRGNIDMVLKGDTGEIPARTKEYLADALLGADRLTKLVNDMLDISRVETGRMKFFLENIELVKFLETIHTEFVPLAEKKHLTLYLACPDDLPPVFSDRGRIFQIIDNFLGNSLKFTPEGGSITISAKAEDSMVVVSVRDTGTGIRQEDQKKLFKRFPQIETTMIDGVKGTGLGLYLTRHIVEGLGGRIWAESPGLGKGATFSFALPRAGSSGAGSLRHLYQSDMPTNAS